MTHFPIFSKGPSVSVPVNLKYNVDFKTLWGWSVSFLFFVSADNVNLDKKRNISYLSHPEDQHFFSKSMKCRSGSKVGLSRLFLEINSYSFDIRSFLRFLRIETSNASGDFLSAKWICTKEMKWNEMACSMYPCIKEAMVTAMTYVENKSSTVMDFSFVTKLPLYNLKQRGSIPPRQHSAGQFSSQQNL